VHKWLDEWKAKFVRTSRLLNQQQLESAEDWTQLRNRKYGEDPVLRLCDESNKRRLAQHITCAMVYEKEIRVLTGKEDESENGALTRLIRHLGALRTSDTYRQVFAAKEQIVDWYAVARYFSSALELGAKQRGESS